MVILPPHMGRIGYLILLLGAALLAPSAAAATPQVYVANGSGYSVAFAGESGKISVLGLDTKLYCSYTEPAQQMKPRPFHRVAAPLSLRAGPAGLTAVVDESEMTVPASLSFTANLGAQGLVGNFSFTGEETPTSHCQTGTYYGGEAAVPFEARPYARFGDPGAAAPAPGETPDYFGRQGPFETFIRDEGKAVRIRGAVVSKCKFGGDHTSTHSPLFGIPYSLKLDGKRSFSRQFKKNAGRAHGQVINEVTRISGTVREAVIDGTYLRRSTTGEGAGARECTLGPLRFHADRYVPGAG
jgi:hypothetical protein